MARSGNKEPKLMELWNTNRPLVALVVIVGVAGVAVLAFGATRHTGDDLGALLALIVLGALAERYAVGLFSSDVSVGVVTVLAAVVLAGSWGVALVAPPMLLLGQVRTESAWYKRLYNIAVYLLAGTAFAGIFHVFGGWAAADAWPEVLVPGLVGAVANYAVNSVLVASAIALSSGEPVAARWRQNYQWLLPQYLVVGLAATAAAAAYHILGIWGLAVFAAPVAGIHHAYSIGAPRTQPTDVDVPLAA